MQQCPRISETVRWRERERERERAREREIEYEVPTASLVSVAEARLCTVEPAAGRTLSCSSSSRSAIKSSADGLPLISPESFLRLSSTSSGAQAPKNPENDGSGSPTAFNNSLTRSFQSEAGLQPRPKKKKGGV